MKNNVLGDLVWILVRTFFATLFALSFFAWTFLVLPSIYEKNGNLQTWLVCAAIIILAGKGVRVLADNDPVDDDPPWHSLLRPWIWIIFALVLPAVVVIMPPLNFLRLFKQQLEPEDNLLPQS